MSEGTTSVGVISLDLIITDTIRAQLDKIAGTANSSVQKSFSSVGDTIGEAVSKPLENVSKTLNKPLDNMKSQIKQSEDEISAIIKRANDKYDGRFKTTWGELELTNWRTVYEGNYVEWVNGGQYLLSARPTVENDLVTFKCQDALSYMTDIYYKGMYHPQGISLYDLAVRVLEDANIPRLYEEVTPYKIDESTKSIFTTAPLPRASHRECLQLIANAARCILYVDRVGVIQIKPINTEQDNFLMDFNTAEKKPKISKIPTLNRVSTKVYSYHSKTEVEELHKSTVEVNGMLSMVIDFEQAVDVTISITGAQAAHEIYSGAVFLLLEGSGTAEILITGKKLESSTTTRTVSVLNGDVNGEIEIVDNPLITNEENATAIGTHIRNYLLLRNTYELEYRGNPELDSSDLIYMESQFDSKFSARLLKHTLYFNGALSGRAILKRQGG